MRDKSFLSVVITSGLVGSVISFVGIIIHYFTIGDPKVIGWVIIPIALIVSFITSFRSANDRFLSGLFSGLISILLVLTVSFLFMWLSGNERSFYNYTRDRTLTAYISYSASAALNYNWMILFYPLAAVLIVVSSLLGSVFKRSR